MTLRIEYALFLPSNENSLEETTMRMSDEEYFRSCVAKERRLAQLLGHEVEEFYESAGQLWDRDQVMPQWTRDWRACGPLITEYGLTVGYRRDPGDTQDSAVAVGPMVVHFRDHPSRDRALMFAVVKAVIAHLEHLEHLKHHPPHGPAGYPHPHE